MTMVEQGMKIYNAIFKRVWRSMKEEFRKLYILNGIYLPAATMFGPDSMTILRNDYLGDPTRIRPVADPAVTSEQQRVQQAITIKQAAMSTPGYNIAEVEKNFLRAMHVDGVDVLYPGPDKVPQGKDPKIALQELKNAAEAMRLKQDQMQFVMDLMEERRLNDAKIMQLQAQAAKLAAEAGGAVAAQQLAVIQTVIDAMKQREEALRGRAELMMKSLEMKNEGSQQQSGGTPPDRGGMGGVAAAPGDESPGEVPAPEADGDQGGLGEGGLRKPSPFGNGGAELGGPRDASVY
jgi:hypothetical protein